MIENSIPPQMPPQVKSFAFFMIGEFLIIVGFFLAVMGIGRVVSKFIGYEGAGELLVGIIFGIIGYAIMMRTRPKQIIITHGGAPPPEAPMEPVKEADVGSYR